MCGLATASVGSAAAAFLRLQAGPRLRELLCWASVLRPVPCVCVLDLCGSQEERSALGETLALCSAERLLPEACRVLSTDDRPCRTLGRTVGGASQPWCLKHSSDWHVRCIYKSSSLISTRRRNRSILPSPAATQVVSQHRW